MAKAMISVGFALVLMAGKDIPLSNFSGNTYSGWTATGNAFRPGPVLTRDLLRRLEIVYADGPVISSEVEDDRPTGTLTSANFKVERRYLSFRIGGGDYAGKTCINLIVDGQVVRTQTGRRSDILIPVQWDLKDLRNKQAQIQIVDEHSGDWGHININRLVLTDKPEPAMVTKPLYKETLRPQYHFTARYWNDFRLNPVEHQEGWINDLNGLIYYDGEYHMFAQRWATCWLHAVSKDLVHWTELEPAFWEEKEGSGVQSGTCVIDYKNTSGLSKDPATPPMIAFWSRFDNRSQCLHYSLDHGRTWKPYEKNPFMDFRERDPKVFWYEPGQHWVMIMYGDGAYHIFNSKNLLDWTNTNHPIPDSFECPDFFQLPIDGDKSKMKWVLIQGSGQYSIGTFDGKEFKEETPRLSCDVGPNFYATQSWANTDTGDGRRIQTAWMRGSAFPNMPFSQQISFPCELSLHSTPDGLRVYRQPIKEVAKLHDKKQSWTKTDLSDGKNLSLAKGDLFHLQANVSIPAGASLTFEMGGVSVVFGANSVESEGRPTTLQNLVTKIEMLIDRGSIEVFVNGGEVSLTRFALPNAKELSVRATGGTVSINSMDLFTMKSIWPNKVN